MATKKLTKAQLAVIAGCSIGDKLWSDPLTNSQQRSIDAMLNHGHLKITGGGYTMVEYTIQDTPEVRAAIAQPAAAPTVSAEPWTPAVGQLVRFKEGVILYGDNHDVDDLQARRVVGKITRMDDGISVDFGLDGSYVCFAYELEPAAAPTVSAEPDASDTLVREWEAEHADPRDAQIAALTRDLASAKAEAAALERELEAVKQAFDGYQAAATDTERQQTATINRLTVACDKLQAERDALHAFAENVGKTIDEMWGSLRPGSDATTRKNAFYHAIEIIVAHLEAINLSPATVPPASDAALVTAAARSAATDTGMVAALKARDNGNRTPADNVLAMFADGEDGTIA